MATGKAGENVKGSKNFDIFKSVRDMKKYEEIKLDCEFKGLIYLMFLDFFSVKLDKKD